MPQRRGRARLDAGDIDAKLGQAHGIADPLFFTTGDHGRKFLRIRCNLLGWNP
jgi:hypothetical protein